MKAHTLTKWVLGFCGAALLGVSACDFIPGTDLGRDEAARSGSSSAVDGQAGGGSAGGDQADGDQGGASQTGTLRILITDKPFPLDLIQEATITVTRIEARLAGDEDSSSLAGEAQDNENENDNADTDGDNENDNDDTDTDGDNENDNDDADTDGDNENDNSAAATAARDSDNDNDADTDGENENDNDDADTDGDDENDNDDADTDGDNENDNDDGDNENDNDDDADTDGLGATEGSGADPSGFVLLFEGEQTISLLELRNGQTAVLANATIPAGSYSEIRLIVTSGSITLADPDNRTFELTVPSGQQTGIKLKLNFEVQAEGETVLLADFDLSRSFKPIPGSGLQRPGDIREFKFSPTLRLSNLDQSATLGGRVTDDQDNPLADVTVIVYRDDQEVTSTFTEADGSYQVLGLDPGTYRLEFALNGFEDAELADLSLEAGQTKEDVDVSLLADGSS